MLLIVVILLTLVVFLMFAIIFLQSNTSIIKNDKTYYKPKLIYQTINTPNANVVTIVNNTS